MIKTEQDLDQALEIHAGESARRERRRRKLTRLNGFLILALFIGAYIEWHLTGGQSTLLWRAITIAAVLMLFLEAIEKIRRP